MKIAAHYKLGPIFTPPVLAKPEGPIATLAMSGFGGGTNWPGGSFDPETHILYVYSQRTLVPFGVVQPEPGRTDMAYVLGKPPGTVGAPAALNVQGLPMIKPPYGSISAIDLRQGRDSAGRLRMGRLRTTCAIIRRWKGLTIPRTGRAGVIRTLVTGTLLVGGRERRCTRCRRVSAQGAMLRAYNKATGQEVGAVAMPAGQTGNADDLCVERQTIHCGCRWRHEASRRSLWLTSCLSDQILIQLRGAFRFVRASNLAGLP